jgi:pimeloyl-ACP methyl ester carboxylesterase
MVQHHVFYVPGILDDIYHAQGILVATWRLYGVHPHIHEMPWAGDGSYDSKFKKLLAAIDGQLERGHKVSLVGASAGASAVINAYADRTDKISGLVYVCGKINGAENVSDDTYSHNPAFKTSMQQLQTNLLNLANEDKNKMLSLYSQADRAVPHEATYIPGVEEKALPAIRHGKAIIYSLSLGAPIIISHLKRQARSAL